MIHLGSEGRRWLLEALRELAAGRPNRFEDLLWLGFGDDWMTVRDALVREGDVRYDSRGEGVALLTPIGEAMIDRLEQHDGRREQAKSASAAAAAAAA